MNSPGLRKKRFGGLSIAFPVFRIMHFSTPLEAMTLGAPASTISPPFGRISSKNSRHERNGTAKRCSKPHQPRRSCRRFAGALNGEVPCRLSASKACGLSAGDLRRLAASKACRPFVVLQTSPAKRGSRNRGDGASGLGRVKTSRRNWPLEFFSCVRQIARADCGAIAWLYLRYSIQAPVCFPNSVPMNLIPGRPRKRILVVFRPYTFSRGQGRFLPFQNFELNAGRPQ